MSRSAVPSIVTAIVVLGLAVGAVLLGQGLLPSKLESIEKGTYAPWLLVWGMIGIVELCALSLAAFLLIRCVQGLSGGDSHARG